MRSFGILRTNPGLTTNIKIMVDSTYGLSLETINSNSELSASKYKKYDFNKDSYLDDIITYFYDGLPADTAYEVKYDDDNKSMTDQFSDQYDEIYQYGARNITDNKNYVEEYEYFAPLYVYKNKLPSHFVIFRVDGPGILSLNKDNFKSEIVKKFKAVSVFDLSKSTAIGQWLDININQNNFFPDTPFEMNFNDIEFSVWKGINYRSGGYVDKSFFMDHILERENEIFELEKFIFDGYRRNEVIFPNILNMSFLFDDTPADEFRLRKWSINRYFGFYLDALEKVRTISPFTPPQLHPDVEVLDNNVLSTAFGDPFVDGWSEKTPTYVECENEYYRIERFTEKQPKTLTGVQNSSKTGTTGAQGTLTDLNDITGQNYKTDQEVEVFVNKWRIIADKSLKGKGSILNTNSGSINLNKEIVMSDGSFITIEDFERCDVWMIEIDGKYHNLQMNSDGNICVVSDYSFYFSDRTYRYLINRNDKNFTKVVSTVVDENNPPKKFTIYRAKFSEIKDFDTRIVDTESSKFEYDMVDEVVDTPEPKLYFTNLNTMTIPKRLDDFYYKDKYVRIPVSSEYTATQETFKTNGGDLSSIWRKNPVYCRWAFEGSISANDYPYTLNNSFAMESFNRTTNPFATDLNPEYRNLEYFYTVNSSSAAYSHHSLHVQQNRDNSPDPFFDFDFESYFGKKNIILGDGSTQSVNYDYFNHFFTIRTDYANGKLVKNTKKYSEFTPGDSNTPNYTLFRGIKFRIHDVSNIKLDGNGRIDVINITDNNTFDDYKFSVLLTQADNGMRWEIVERWDLNKKFKKGDVVLHDDILYVATRDTVCVDPTVLVTKTVVTVDPTSSTTLRNKTTDSVFAAPYYLLDYKLSGMGPSSIVSPAPSRLSLIGQDTVSGRDWQLYYLKTLDNYLNEVFWDPIRAIRTGINGYNLNDVVYRDGIYYVFTSSERPYDFWNPVVSVSLSSQQFAGEPERFGYSAGTVVYYKRSFYRSNVNGNVKNPLDAGWTKIGDVYDQLKWRPIEVWFGNKQYNVGDPVIYKNIVYRCLKVDQLSREPNKVQDYWRRLYSFEVDTDFVYTDIYNPYVIQNNEVYRIVSNSKNLTVDNGIRVIINHIHKNVLVNIYVNDNTLPNLRDTDRGNLYRGLYQKLSANNFINAINDISEKYGFSDYLKYVVVGKDGTVTEHNLTNDLTSLKHIVFAEGPEEIEVKTDSLRYLPVNEARLKPTKTLKDSRITELSELENYNNTNFAVEIYKSPETLEVLGGFKTIKKPVYRFNGGYSPLFYEVQLFNTDNSIDFNTIDLVFDTSDTMEVFFLFEKDGVRSETNYTLSPAKNFTSARQYYSQVVDVVSNHFPNIEFNYEILRKRKQAIGGETLILETDSYNDKLNRWFDTSGNEQNFKPWFGSTASPKRVMTDLYPGPHSRFFGNNVVKSLMLDDSLPVLLDTTSRSYEFIVRSDEVSLYRVFAADDGKILFGFEANRVFMVNRFEDNSFEGVYSDGVLQNDTWYHVVFTISVVNNTSSIMRVYVDSVERTTSDVVSLTHTNVKVKNSLVMALDISLILGGLYFTQEYFSGGIAEVRFYERALTVAEIYERYVAGHSLLSIRYKEKEGDIKLEIVQNIPRLLVDIYDFNDPLYPVYQLNLTASGGNPPYLFSYNGSAFSSVNEYTAIPKPSSNYVIVKDSIGLTSSFGYYIINSVIEYKTEIDGPFLY